MQCKGVNAGLKCGTKMQRVTKKCKSKKSGSKVSGIMFLHFKTSFEKKNETRDRLKSRETHRQWMVAS